MIDKFIKDKSLLLSAAMVLVTLGYIGGYLYAGYSVVHPLYSEYAKAHAQLSWYKWCAKHTYEQQNRISTVQYTIEGEDQHICVNLDKKLFAQYPSRIFRKQGRTANNRSL